MHVFSDESGSFAKLATPGEAWSVVATYAIPSQYLSRLEQVVGELKNKLGCNNPKIGDFPTEKYLELLEFIKAVSGLHGTLFVAPVDRSEVEAAFQTEVCNSDDQQIPEGDNPIKGKSQIQIQANIAYEVLNSTLWGALYRYSRSKPRELENFTWRLDQKGPTYEQFIQHNLLNWFSGEASNYQYILPSPPHDLSYFNAQYWSKQSEQISLRKVFSDFSFDKSKNSAGIQLVGILAGAVRGCLMEKYDEHQESISRALGRLMMRQPRSLRIFAKRLDSPGLEKNIMPVHRKFCQLSNRWLETMTKSSIKIT